MVVQLGDHHPVPRRQLATQRPGEPQRQRRHARAEGDLVRGAAEQVRHRDPAPLHDRVGLLARRVVPAPVPVVLQQVRPDRVRDGGRDLRPPRSVEIRHRPPAHLPAECGETVSDRFRGERGCGGCGFGRHGLSV